jgi:hypothetical protein
MCYPTSVMLGGRRFCAISLLPTPSFNAHHPLSPIIPALTVDSPVTPIIPALTHNPGVGGAVLFTGRWSPITGHGLTPLFPLDTTIPPVSPLFPLDTKNRGYPSLASRIVPIRYSPLPRFLPRDFLPHSLECRALQPAGRQHCEL